jgi:hypothetical protein
VVEDLHVAGMVRNHRLARDVNAAVNLARLAGSASDSNGRGADQKTRSGGQVAVKGQPGTRQRGQTGSLPSQGESAIVALAHPS